MEGGTVRGIGWPLTLLLLAGVHLAGLASVLFTPAGIPVASFWPAAGLAVGLLVTSPSARWPLLWLAVLVLSGAANLLGGRELATAALYGVGNATGALVAAATLRGRAPRAPRLDSHEVFLRVVVAAALEGSVAAAAIASAVPLGWAAGELGTTFWAIFTSHAASVLALLPIALAPSGGRPAGRGPELLAQTAVLAAVTGLVFVPDLELSPSFLPLLLLVWAGLRFDVCTVTWQLAAFSVCTSLATAQGYGPFGSGLDGAGGVALEAQAAAAVGQLYLVCAVLLSLPLAIAVRQRGDLLARVSADERLFRRNFTESLAGMAFLACQDDQLRLVDLNQAAVEILGGDRDRLLGRQLVEVLDHPQLADVAQRLADGRSEGWRGQAGLAALTGRDGGRVHLALSLLAGGQVPLFSAQLLDVTAERASAGLVSHLMQASIRTALVGFDAAGRIRVFNSGAQHLLDYDLAQVHGEPFHRLLDPGQLLARTGADTVEEGFGRLVADVTAAGEVAARDWTWLSRTGRRHIVSMTLSAAPEAAALGIGFLCVGREVTEQRHSQQLLVAALEKEREAVEQLRALDRAKDEFVSTVSHELRTPITSIVGYTELLQDGAPVPARPEQLPFFDNIARNGQRLIALCNDLLDLSSLDSGSVQWSFEPLDLAVLLPAVEDSVGGLLAGRRLELAFDTAPVPVRVHGDRLQLERLLLNLLSNAVKFTEDGGSVVCQVAREDGSAVLRVQDTGMGIPVEEQEALFTKFFRSSTAQDLAIQGTGLGLSIVAGIVHAHDGTIEVDSEPWRGTTVTVRIPLAPA